MRQTTFLRWVLVGVLLQMLVWPLTSTAVEAATVSTKLRVQPLEASQIELGPTGGYAIERDGTAWAWGQGADGTLGNATEFSVFSPIKMHIENVRSIARGDKHALILKEDGTVWAVGHNEEGQLGIGSISEHIVSEPVQVKGLTNVLGIAAGSRHSLAFKKDGTVWAWGSNSMGQLGLSFSIRSLIPVQVAGLPSIVELAAWGEASLALGNGGEVLQWGMLSEVDKHSGVNAKPVQIATEEAHTLAAGERMNAAVNFLGEVTVWASSSVSTVQGHVASGKVSGLSGIMSIAIDRDNLIAVRDDGTVWTVHSALRGVSKPVMRKDISNATCVEVKAGRTMVLRKDGTVLSWGNNQHGATGLGSFEERIPTPQQIRKPIELIAEQKDYQEQKDLKDQELSISVMWSEGQVHPYLSVRDIALILKAKTEWDAKSKTVTITSSGVKLELHMKTGAVYKNAKQIADSEPPLFAGSTSMLPLSLLTAGLDVEASWDVASNVIRIKR